MGRKFQIRMFDPDAGVWIWQRGLFDTLEQAKQQMFTLHINSKKDTAYACEQVKKERRGVKRVPS